MCQVHEDTWKVDRMKDRDPGRIDQNQKYIYCPGCSKLELHLRRRAPSGWDCLACQEESLPSITLEDFE